MAGRILIVVGLLCVIGAAARYAVPRMFPRSGIEEAGGHTRRVDPAAALAARASAVAPAILPARVAEADRVATEALRGLTDENRAERLARVRRDLEENGETALRHAALGWLLAGSKEPEAARAEVERALEMDPECAFAVVASGLLHLRRGRFSRAETRFRQAVRGDPRAAEWRRMLAISLLAQGRDREALAAAERALALGVQDPACYLTVGDVYLRMARFSEAVEWYDAAAEVAGPESEVVKAQAPVVEVLRARAR